MNVYETTLTLALTFFGANIQQADAQVIQSVVISGTEFRQSKTQDNNVTTKTLSPTRLAFTTKTLEQDLARDETTAENWFTNSPNKFPANAKIHAVFPNAGDFSSVIFSVAQGTNVIDISNLLSAAPADGNAVLAGAFLDANGANQLPFTAVAYNEYRITYDATPVGGTTHFTVTGMGVFSTTMTKPKSKGKGIFSELDTFTLENGTGDGVDSNTNTFALTGVTLTANGRGTAFSNQ